MTLSDAQMQEIADRLFLMKEPAQTKLAKPANTAGANDLTARLDPVGNDLRFRHMGIGVVDFTANAMAPKLWLNHNADVAWRIGSTAKVSMLLAAGVLREDVRAVQQWVAASGLTWSPADYDDVFAMPKLWAKSKNIAQLAKLKGIAGKENAPRISTIFDLSKTPAEFFGPDSDAPDGTAIFAKLQGEHLSWAKAPEFDFSERLWLAGARSDNLAATTCISEIGVAYLKAVQRAFGLFDAAIGMHLLLAGAYNPLPEDEGVRVSTRAGAGAAVYRQPTRTEMNSVNGQDLFYNTATKRFDDRKSKAPGSASALLAYMVALMQDKLLGPSVCKTIRANLGGGITANALTSYIPLGLDAYARVNLNLNRLAEVTFTLNKIGILGVQDGAKAPLLCEMAYLETRELVAPAQTMKYGLVLTGIRATADTGDLGVSEIVRSVARAVHMALR